MKRVKFLIANEHPGSGLIEDQLLGPARSVLNSAFSVLAFLRLGSNAHVPADDSVQVSRLLVPYRLINYYPWVWVTEVLALVYAFRCLLSLRTQGPYKQIWARSYVPGLTAWWLKKMTGKPYTFDPRSLYLLEHDEKMRGPRSLGVQRYWQWVERRILASADRIVCVSQGMVKFYKECYPTLEHTRFVLIPCFAEASLPIDPKNSAARTALGVGPNEVVILYYGSLNFGWNDVRVYSKWIQQTAAPNYRFLFVTQDADFVRTLPLANDPRVMIYKATELETRLGKSCHFLAADFGVILMPRTADWETRLSVKFANYIVHGLPVIVGEYVGEAVRLIQHNQLAPSITLKEHEATPTLSRPLERERQRIAEWGSQYFTPGNLRKGLIP